jgi:predicted DNA-binding protein
MCDMGKPTSFRLPADLLVRLEEEATSTGSSVTALVSSLLDEGLKIRRFPGITYRGGPAGRRAGLVGGPDVWELVRAVQRGSGEGEQRLRNVADELGISSSQVRLAVDFYLAFPEEIDERIAADERAAARLHELIERRDRLMSG